MPIMCVCMYVWDYLHVFIFVYLHVFTVYVYIHIHTYNTHTMQRHIYKYVCLLYVCGHVYRYVGICVWVCAYMYVWRVGLSKPARI